MSPCIRASSAKFHHDHRRSTVIASAEKIQPAAAATASNRQDQIAELIRHHLDEGKAEEIVVIDLEGKSSVTDLLVIATGRSDRQVIALADRVAEALKKTGVSILGIEGKEQGDWVLIDAGDAIVHLFRPEVRSYYNLEKIWGLAAPQPADSVAAF